MRPYLQPGRHMVAVLSGSFSAFGLVNRLLPDRVGRRLAARTLRIDEHCVFPAHYDRCTDRALTRLLTPWSTVEIESRFFSRAWAASLRPLALVQLSALPYVHVALWRGPRLQRTARPDPG